MKNYLKNELKHLPMIIIVSIIFCGINTLANNHLFNSKDVDYDNSNTHIESTNVGDAIDELFDAANNFTTYDTRLQGVETKVGTGTLNTTAQNLIGGVNELNGKIKPVGKIITMSTGVRYEDGLVRQIGTLVVVQIRLSFDDTFSGNVIATGFPAPESALSNVVFCNTNNINVRCFISTNGKLTLASGSVVPSGILICNITYITAE